MILGYFVGWDNLICGVGLFLIGPLCLLVLRALDKRDQAKRELLQKTIDLQRERIESLTARLRELRSD